ncbi:hypothetical protein D3C81_1520190 [compost metagenome]
MPTYETWFMEGTLLPDYHFICIKNDYSDLEEKLQFYIDHPDEAETIVKQANAYVKLFMDQAQEEFVSLHVLKKYFVSTGQSVDL